MLPIPNDVTPLPYDWNTDTELKAEKRGYVKAQRLNTGHGNNLYICNNTIINFYKIKIVLCITGTFINKGIKKIREASKEYQVRNINSYNN